MAGADHIGMKNVKILRRYFNLHIIEQWYFYCSFYDFPLIGTVGSCNYSYQKTIENEDSFHDFLKSDESMLAFNVS